MAATLGLLVAFQGLAQVIWGTYSQFVPSLFPTHSVSLGNSAYVGVDRLYMFGVAILVAVLLWVGFRFTRVGLATQATSENERGAALLGFSPTVISAANWGLGCALAALAGILIAPITTLDSAPCRCSCSRRSRPPWSGASRRSGSRRSRRSGLAGRSRGSSGLDAAGRPDGCSVRGRNPRDGDRRRPLPSRGAISEGRPPLAPAGFRHRWLALVGAVAAGVVMLLTFDATYQAALATTFQMAILALSLVVLTGYVGQISLMQLTFAGLGGWFTAKLASTSTCLSRCRSCSPR